MVLKGIADQLERPFPITDARTERRMVASWARSALNAVRDMEAAEPRED